jgi:hypothetical protein
LLTDAQHRKVLWRLLRHEDPKVRAQAEYAVKAVVHEDEKSRPWTDRELQQQIVWVLGNGATLLANGLTNITYVVPTCMTGIRDLAKDGRSSSRIIGKVTKGAIEAAVVALSKPGPGRRTGSAIGDRATLISAVFGQLGLTTTPAAVSKLLQRHAQVDLGVIRTKAR